MQIWLFKPDMVQINIPAPTASLTRQLKADPATRHITIVAFSAFALKGDELGLRAAGFDG